MYIILESILILCAICIWNTTLHIKQHPKSSRKRRNLLKIQLALICVIYLITIINGTYHIIGGLQTFIQTTSGKPEIQSTGTLNFINIFNGAICIFVLIISGISEKITRNHDRKINKLASDYNTHASNCETGATNPMQTINSLVKNKTITEDNARELIRHIQVKDLTPFGKLLTTHPKKVYCIHIDKPLREILSNHTKNKKMKIETPVYAITNETESGPKNIWLLAHGTDALQTSQHEEYN